MTFIIKGVAIIFMIVLHCFGGREWYMECYDIPMNGNAPLLKFMSSLQICVGIYVFMIGFGYSFCKQKNLSYSFNHVRSLLKVFWSTLILFTLPVSLSYISTRNSEWFFLNLFGVIEDLSWVSWFVALYVWAMILMPLLGRLLDRYKWKGLIGIICCCWLLLIAIHSWIPHFNSHHIWHTLFVCIGWTPLICIGYSSGKYQLIEKVKIKHNLCTLLTAIVIIPLVLWLKSQFKGILILNFDIIYAPVIIYCILCIFTIIKSLNIKRCFISLGKFSVYMWFIHAIFFTECTRPTYQPLIMLSNNLWFITLNTIILTYIISVLFKKLIS